MAAHVGLLDSAARTVDTDSKLITVAGKYEALHVIVDITAGSPNLIVTVKGRDQTSGKSYTLLTSSNISTGTTVLRVGPQYTAGANVAKDYLPYNWYVSVTQSGNVDTTYSIGASMM